MLIDPGGKCGSTYIDRLFINWMEERFGAAYTRLAWAKRGPSSTFMNNFEGIKQDFGSTTSKSYEMHLVMQGVSDSDHYDTSEWNVKISE